MTVSATISMSDLTAVQFDADVTLQLDGTGDTGTWPKNVPLCTGAAQITVSAAAAFNVFKMKGAKGCKGGHALQFFNVCEIEAVV